MNFIDKIKEYAQKVVKDKKVIMSPAKMEEQQEKEQNKNDKENFVISYDASDDEKKFELPEKSRQCIRNNNTLPSKAPGSGAEKEDSGANQRVIQSRSF